MRNVELVFGARFNELLNNVRRCFVAVDVRFHAFVLFDGIDEQEGVFVVCRNEIVAKNVATLVIVNDIFQGEVVNLHFLFLFDFFGFGFE